MREARDGREEPSILRELWVASQVTRGNIYEWPWYENAVPPFNHVCELCEVYL